MIQIEKLTIDALLKQSFEKYGNLPSIASVGEKPMTYAELEKAVRSRMEDLISHGIKHGDRVMILGDNCPNWVIAYLALTFMGSVAVPVLPGFSDDNVLHILRDSGSVAAFVAAKRIERVRGADPLGIVWQLEDFTVAWTRPVSKTGPGPRAVQKPKGPVPGPSR